MKSCEADIDRLQCDGKGKTPHGKMAHLMLCLEKAISNGKVGEFMSCVQEFKKSLY